MKDKKQRLFNIIQIGNKEDIPSRAFDIVIVINIVVNILITFLMTFDYFTPLFGVFKVIEFVTIFFFCVEYALRIWTADYLYENITGPKAVIKFLLSYDGIIDLLTIIPAFFLSGFVVFRMLRVVRIFHLFRLNNSSDSFNVITSVLYKRKNQLASSLFIILVLIMASSLCMYSAEHEVQPAIFNNAFSGIWWAVSTVLTVGYGDIYPVTILGRIMACVIAFLGVGVVAIPTGIISAGFVDEYANEKSKDRTFIDIKEISEIFVDKNHAFISMEVADIRNEYAIEILMILREDVKLIASPETKIRENDIVIARQNC